MGKMSICSRKEDVASSFDFTDANFLNLEQRGFVLCNALFLKSWTRAFPESSYVIFV